MPAHGAENGIGGVAHARLDGKEGLWDQAAAQFAGQKISHILTDLRRGLVRFAERAGFVRGIIEDQGDNFVWVDFNGGRADAVRGPENGQRIAIWRVLRLVNVVKAAQRDRMKAVQFDDDFVGLSAKSRGSADGGGAAR